ncbi:MAG: glycosyltransferase family 4 protein [Tannerellaceae bacterium]
MSQQVMMIIFVVATFVIAAAVGLTIIPRIVFISHSKQLFDVPNERSSHKTKVPRLGGLAFFPGLLFAFALTLGLRMVSGYDLDPVFAPYVYRELLFLLCGFIVLYLVGIADDLITVHFSKKFVAQILASALMIIGGVYINNFHGFLGLHEVSIWIGAPVTVLLVVFVINAINLIDGIDGLASGLCLVALTVYGIWFTTYGLTVYGMLAFGMVGVIAPFFYFNVFSRQRKIFMGDTGSLMLGFMLAFLSARFCMFAVEPQYNVSNAPIWVFALLFIPLFDALRVFLDRIRRGKSPFLPERNHIHHKFLALGFSHRRTMFMVNGLAIAIIGLNIWATQFLNIHILLVADLIFGAALMFSLHRIRVHQENKEEDVQAEPVKANVKA